MIYELHDLRFAYRADAPEVLQGISLDLAEGQLLTILGCNGSGKSTLFGCMLGLLKPQSGSIKLCGEEIAHESIHKRSVNMSHIPEDRHKHGLILDFSLEQNMVLQRFNDDRFQKLGFIKSDEVRKYSDGLIEKYDVRSGQGSLTIARAMSGGNQQKAIIGREIDRDKKLIVAVQPTRGLDVGAIEYVHSQLVQERDKGKP